MKLGQVHSGFTVSYDGYDGGDLNVNLSFDPSTNFAEGDTALARTGTGSSVSTVTDNGGVSFGASDLSGITPGFVDINISHWEFHIDTLTNGRTVVARSSYSTDTYLYLTP